MVMRGRGGYREARDDGYDDGRPVDCELGGASVEVVYCLMTRQRRVQSKLGL